MDHEHEHMVLFAVDFYNATAMMTVTCLTMLLQWRQTVTLSSSGCDLRGQVTMLHRRGRVVLEVTSGGCRGSDM